jgi:hypothetical protein
MHHRSIPYKIGLSATFACRTVALQFEAQTQRRWIGQTVVDDKRLVNAGVQYSIWPRRDVQRKGKRSQLDYLSTFLCLKVWYAAVYST